MKRALICGISGQDGAYLAQLLLEHGYKVYGTSRDAQMNTFANLAKLGIREEIELISMTLIDFRSVMQTLDRIQPDEVYNLAGQSSVGLSFEQPVESMESISVGTLNLLESTRLSGQPIKLYNAGSGECYGDTGDSPADETTPFRPRSPYAVAKAAAYWQVANYREAYNLNARTGILFNHESPLRPERFVTRKIIKAACRISTGSNEKLRLGDISIKRDWGWAPNYVKAIWLIIQHDEAEDFVIATGRNNSLEQFTSTAFNLLDLDWREYVIEDPSLFRPTDISSNLGNPGKAKLILNWEPELFMEDIINLMIESELSLL